MEPNDDGLTAHVVIDETVDASSLDALIRRLALLRADMRPEVPMTRDSIMASGQEVTVEDKPSLVIAKRTNGGFRLWLRHRGVGWIAYELGEVEAVHAAKYVLSRSDDNGVDLIDHDEPHRH